MNVIKTNFDYAKPLIPLDINNVEYLVIHHPEAIIASPEDIHQWHLERGFSGFGYNEYIRKDGTVYIGRGDYIGAHCQSYNSTSYGICCEGDYNKELLMPEVQKQSVVERIRFHKARFAKYKMTVPHGLLFNTECPGKSFPLGEILKRSEVNNLTTEEAMAVLVEKGIVSSPDYWMGLTKYVKFFDAFIINVAKALTK